MCNQQCCSRNLTRRDQDRRPEKRSRDWSQDRDLRPLTQATSLKVALLMADSTWFLFCFVLFVCFFEGDSLYLSTCQDFPDLLKFSLLVHVPTFLFSTVSLSTIESSRLTTVPTLADLLSRHFSKSLVT